MGDGQPLFIGLGEISIFQCLIKWT
jgi:hypothetical protein